MSLTRLDIALIIGFIMWVCIFFSTVVCAILQKKYNIDDKFIENLWKLSFSISSALIGFVFGTFAVGGL